MLRRAERRKMFWCWGLSLIEKCDFNFKLFLVHFTKGIEPRLLAFTLSCFLLLFLKWRQEKEACKMITKVCWPTATVEPCEAFGDSIQCHMLFPLHQSEKAGCFNGKWGACIYFCQRVVERNYFQWKKGVLAKLIYFSLYIFNYQSIAVFITQVS